MHDVSYPFIIYVLVRLRQPTWVSATDFDVSPKLASSATYVFRLASTVEHEQNRIQQLAKVTAFVM